MWCCTSSAEVHEVHDGSFVKHSACIQEPPEQSFKAVEILGAAWALRLVSTPV